MVKGISHLSKTESKMATTDPAKRRRRPKPPQRKCFLLDRESLTDLNFIQVAHRATTTTAAVRNAVRVYAQLIRYAAEGRQVCLKGPDDTIIMDVPTPGDNGASR